MQLLLSVLGCARARNTLKEEVSNSSAVLDKPGIAEYFALPHPSYLQACILEALRLHPPVHLLESQVTMDKEVHLWGYRVPVGTVIVPNYNACLKATCFHPMVHSFQPERWMTNDLEKLTDMKRHLDTIWGNSSTQHLIMDITCMQIHKGISNVSSLLSQILQLY